LTNEKEELKKNSMIISTEKLAKKYAVAFVNLFSNKIDKKVTLQLLRLSNFLRRNRGLYVRLRVPGIKFAQKSRALSLLISHFVKMPEMRTLSNLLIKHKRTELLDTVIIQIIRHYRKVIGEELFRIYSSHKLSEEQKRNVIRFI